MNLPVLGALFRSRDYLRNETELLIVVTPYIVHALDPSEVVRPDKNFRRRATRKVVPRPREAASTRPADAAADAGICGQDRLHHAVGGLAEEPALTDGPGRIGRPRFSLCRPRRPLRLRAIRVVRSGASPALQVRHPVVVASASTSLNVYPVGGRAR